MKSSVDFQALGAIMDYKKNVRDICKVGSYLGWSHMAAASQTLGINIHSVFPFRDTANIYGNWYNTIYHANEKTDKKIIIAYTHTE